MISKLYAVQFFTNELLTILFIVECTLDELFDAASEVSCGLTLRTLCLSTSSLMTLCLILFIVQLSYTVVKLRCKN